jgi:ABC-type glycerol-3-phosphate transport system substrate-binding protein
MKKVQRILTILVIFAVIAGLSACSRSGSANAGGSEGRTQSGTSPEDITLRLAFTAGSTSKEILDKGLALFTDQTGIKVEVVFIPGTWAEYCTKIQTMIAGGDSPDTANVAIEGFQLFAKSGMAMPIDDWIARHRAEYDALAKDIDPAVMALMNFDGKQYGIPNEWNNVVTHFNTKLLEEAGLPLPPPDWGKDEFIRYAQALTKKRPDGTMQYAMFLPIWHFTFASWLYNNNGAYLTDDFKKSRLLDPEVVEMFQLMYDLVYTYHAAPIPEPGMDNTRMLEEGTVAMHFSGRWSTITYVMDGFKDVAVQYVPNFKTNVTVWGGTGVFTLNASKHQEEAIALAVFMASRPWIETVMQAGAIPVLNSVAREMVTSLGVPQNAEIFFNNAPVIKPIEAPVQYAETANLVERVIHDILVNKADIMTTLRAADAEMNLILADN